MFNKKKSSLDNHSPVTVYIVDCMNVRSSVACLSSVRVYSSTSSPSANVRLFLHGFNIFQIRLKNNTVFVNLVFMNMEVGHNV